jgi:lactoylglutathione lyase
LASNSAASSTSSGTARRKPRITSSACPDEDVELEFTFNHDGRAYELGSAYGHVAYAVDDLDETLSALAGQGIEPEREPYRVREGGSRICFVQDPDS